MADETWLTWPEALASLMKSDGSLLKSVRQDQAAYLDPVEGQNRLIARAVTLLKLDQDERPGPLTSGNMWSRQAEAHLFDLLEEGDARCLASLEAGGLRAYSPLGVEWRGVRCTVADDAFVIERIGHPSRVLFYDPVFRLPTDHNVADLPEAWAGKPIGLRKRFVDEVASLIRGGRAKSLNDAATSVARASWKTMKVASEDSARRRLSEDFNKLYDPGGHPTKVSGKSR